MCYITVCRVVFVMNNTWITEHDGMARNIKINKRARRYHNIVAYCHISDNGRVDANGDAVSYNRRAFSFTPVFSSDRTTFMKVYIITDLHSGTCRNIVRMPQIKSPSNLGVMRNFYPVFSCVF